MSGISANPQTQDIVRQHNQRTLNSLRVADRVEFKRKGYSHWGLYIGRGKIIHVTAIEEDNYSRNFPCGSVCSLSGASFTKVKVTIDDFWKVAGNDYAYKNNDKDGSWDPLSPGEIIKRAEAKIGEWSYNVFFNNCENFTNWCRYDKDMSDQGVGGALLVGGLAAVGLIGLVAGVHSLTRNRSRNQSDDM